MHSSITLLTFVLSVTTSCSSWSIPRVENIENNLNPAHARQVRQVLSGSVKVNDQGGIRGTLGASETLLNKNGHQLDGHGQISKTWNPNGPVEFGGGLNYQGPSAGASIDVNHAKQLGTNLNAQGNINLWSSHDGGSKLDGAANYNRHLGGPVNYGVGVTFSKRF